jgi:hypothetical protein
LFSCNVFINYVKRPVEEKIFEKMLLTPFTIDKQVTSPSLSGTPKVFASSAQLSYRPNRQVP